MPDPHGYLALPGARACSADDRPVMSAGSADAAEPTRDAATRVASDTVSPNRASTATPSVPETVLGEAQVLWSAMPRPSGVAGSDPVGHGSAGRINLACRQAQRTVHPDP